MVDLSGNQSGMIVSTHGFTEILGMIYGFTAAKLETVNGDL